MEHPPSPTLANAPPLASPSPPPMELPVRLGRVQTLQEHFQVSTPHGALTKSLFDGVRGCCFSVHLQDPDATGGRGTANLSGTLAHLVFRNFYTAALRLVQVNRDGSFAVLLEEQPLMQHAHCEDDAQNWHVVPLDNVDWSKFESFCVYLFQPSPLWAKWEVQRLKLYCQARAVPQSEVPASSVAAAQTNEEETNAKSSPTLGAANNSATSTPASASSTSPPNALTSDDRLAQRPSRTALASCLDSKDAQESAASCLSLAARLRVLLHSNSQQT